MPLEDSTECMCSVAVMRRSMILARTQTRITKRNPSVQTAVQVNEFVLPRSLLLVLAILGLVLLFLSMIRRTQSRQRRVRMYRIVSSNDVRLQSMNRTCEVTLSGGAEFVRS